MLETKEKLSVEDMKQLQLNNTNRLAEIALPILLDYLKDENNPMVGELEKWNCDYSKKDNLAAFFNAFWNKIEESTWDELRRYPFFLNYPDDVVLLDLLKNNGNSKYFDLMDTNEKEGAKQIVAMAFEEALKEQHGKTTWGENNMISLTHLAKIPTFSKADLQADGFPEAINAMSKDWGPSLRMIVEMGDTPKAFGIYAGGQSGNPGAGNYSNFVDDWMNGVYYELERFISSKEAKKKAKYTWVIK